MRTRPMRSFTLALGLSLSVAALAAGPARAGATDSDEERAARWSELKTSIFGDARIEPSDTMVKIDAPKRAEDASLVPVTLTMPEKDKIKSLSFVIDDNPSPHAANFTFGPAADAGQIKLRVRINNYTNVHAVAQTKDGRFYETAAFVKASGGCSAPVGVSDEEAMQGMGEMRLKFAGEPQAGKPMEATLMIRHPNFSGMQMNQVSRDYTPARFIQKLDVSYGDTPIFHMDGDISIASNPVIGFDFKPEGNGTAKGVIKVVAADNQGGRWEHSFPVPSPSN